ncbi:hypothetical protein LR48_Vigan524s000100 [Vigna angularis]|uniref:Uncharacterized protein n=1 Tax=Phaseolus angularis TaxID=3914 RepID=A0A0L9TCI2_PHAAN|nr:hypothetical protein LR48_Vigan524s000100 [Vigna angularis]
MASVKFADRHRFLNRGIFRRDSHHHHQHQKNPNLTTTTTTIIAATIDTPPPLALPSRGDALAGDFGDRESDGASQRESDGARPRGGRRDRGRRGEATAREAIPREVRVRGRRRDRGEGGESEGREARVRGGRRKVICLGPSWPEVVEADTPRSFLPTDAVYPFHLGFLLTA